MGRFEEYLITEGNDSELYLETGSCCGLFLTSEDVSVLKLNDFESIKETLNNIISKNSNRDWSTKKIADGYIRKAGEQALGMYNFINSSTFPLNRNKLDFIHGNIEKYYTVEKSLFSLPKSSKKNTADVVLCEGNRNDILNMKSVGSSPSIGNPIIMNGIKFIQISLKAKKGDTKLGNVKTLLKTKDVGTYIPGDTLYEGIIKDIYDKIKDTVKSLKSKFKGVFGKYKNIKIEKYLNESAKSLSILYKEIDKNIWELQKMVDITYFPLIFKDLSKKPTVIDDPDEEWYIRYMLASNLVSIKLAKDLYKNIVQKQGNIVKQMISNGYFGGTELPLWIVYGDSYHYLGTKDTMLKDTSIKGELCAFKMTPNTGYNNLPYYFVTNFYILDSVDEQGYKSYAELAAQGKPSNSTYAIEFRGKPKTIGPRESIVSGWND